MVDDWVYQIKPMSKFLENSKRSAAATHDAASRIKCSNTLPASLKLLVSSSG
jgi:hypothetical protein